MKLVKITVLTLFMIFSAITVRAVTITGPVTNYGIISNEITWHQDVLADNTGILHFTIYLTDWNDIPEPEFLTGHVRNNGVDATETIWYNDIGTQSITFSWNNTLTVDKGDWYTFDLYGEDDIWNHSLHFTNNIYQGDLYSNLGSMPEYNLIFENNVIQSNPVPEPATMMLLGIGLLCIVKIRR